ncbi:ornithine carbamoyltransferase [Candidatus Micrarchaeota archaeon]|nr:ornithine carbamoyltransferase [Candidatus Micrarchaeota archaeon]MBD3418400.1 ornithine carbamoyltransferase [Candidatus Micrarchaeota archaeon]
MDMDLKGRNFLTLLDYSKEELEYLLDVALKMKKGELVKKLPNKTLAMLFQKSSTRTRMSFEAGMTRLGGAGMFLDIKNTQLGRGETIEDTAKTMSRYVEGIMARLNDHKDIEGLGANATVPVINALTDMYHPCQTMADMLTVLEKKGKVEGLKVVYVGDCGFNMFHSTMIGFSKLGANVVGLCPDKEEYKPKPEMLEKARAQATGSIEVSHNPADAMKDADVVYTDVWVSMGQDEEKAKRLADFDGFQVNNELMGHAKPDAIFMHCLPAHRGEEVAAEVIDSEKSVVFDEAENRLWAQNAILVELMGGTSE